MIQVTYRGRIFNVLKEFKTYIILENYDKTPRKVLKDEVVFHLSKKENPIFSKPTIKETEILEPKEDMLPSTPSDSKDLQEKLQSGSYVSEISAPYPDGSGNTTYRVFFDLIGQHLEETSINRIDDVDTGEKNVDLNTLNLDAIEKAINVAIQNGAIIPVETSKTNEIDEEKIVEVPEVIQVKNALDNLISVIKTTTDPATLTNLKSTQKQLHDKYIELDSAYANTNKDLEEMTIKNTGQTLDAKKDTIDDLPNQTTMQTAPYVPGKSYNPPLNSIKYVDESATKDELAKNHNMPGVNVSTETSPERHEKNTDVIGTAISNEFHEEIKKMLAEISDSANASKSPTGIRTINYDLDSGKNIVIEYKVFYSDSKLNIAVLKLADAQTGEPIDYNSLPFEEKQEIEGAIKGAEDIEI